MTKPQNSYLWFFSAKQWKHGEAIQIGTPDFVDFVAQNKHLLWPDDQQQWANNYDCWLQISPENSLNTDGDYYGVAPGIPLALSGACQLFDDWFRRPQKNKLLWYFDEDAIHVERRNNNQLAVQIKPPYEIYEQPNKVYKIEGSYDISASSYFLPRLYYATKWLEIFYLGFIQSYIAKDLWLEQLDRFVNNNLFERERVLKQNELWLDWMDDPPDWHIDCRVWKDYDGPPLKVRTFPDWDKFVG